MTRNARLIVTGLLIAVLLAAGCSNPNRAFWSKKTAPLDTELGSVRESPREIPVIYDVDVVVVGGSSGAVAAATAAAQQGARVFLAAPRPYLGEDICGTYRLWLEPDETPTSALAKTLFAEPDVAKRIENALPFTYEADTESAALHRDSTPPKLLTDGKWHSAPSQSVQYDGDVTITADLGESQKLRRVHIMAYQRNNDFEVDRITVQTSNDAKAWGPAATIKNGRLGQGNFEETAIQLSAWLNHAARYVRFKIRKPTGAGRILLGEIVIEKPAGRPVASPHRIPPTPMQVKRTLDDALLNAGVEFLYGCYATDVLRDDKDNLAGIVMANRSGRQAVRAKVIIDATTRGAMARAAGARFTPYPAGEAIFKRIVVGGTMCQSPGMEARQMPSPMYTPDGQLYDAFEYTLRIPMADGSFASFANAEQVARDKTWHDPTGGRFGRCCSRSRRII